MQKQKKYSFKKNNYDKDGRNKFDSELLFSDKIKEFEKDFIEENSKIMPANYLFANSQSMLLFERCFILDKNESFGADLINGEIDFGTNFKIEEYSKYQLTYAIGSFLDENVPLYVIIDNNLKDNEIILKFISDDDGENEEMTTPIAQPKIDAI